VAGAERDRSAVGALLLVASRPGAEDVVGEVLGRLGQDPPVEKLIERSDSGEPPASATKSRVVIQLGQQKFEGTETITRREPADLREIQRTSVVHFDREIVGEGMWSAVRDRLTEAGPETTLWESENEYRFSGFLMKLVGLLMPGAFRKQSQQHMQDFKAFAEQGQDVREATN
jgi:hypothetical protein